MSRLPRRTQGRIPIRLTPTHWAAMINSRECWAGDSVKDLVKFLVFAKPQPLDVVDLYRNGRHIFHGTWDGIADDPTLW